MRSPRTFLLVLLVSLWLSLLCSANATTTLLTNGGFETGDFTGWLTAGDTLVVDSSFGAVPPGGTYQALITNAPGGPSEPVHTPGFTYSGHFSIFAIPLGGPENQSRMEAFLGLPAGTLLANTRGGIPWEGSALRQSFTANAGDTVSFTWDYLTNEPGGGVGCSQLDMGFVVLDGTFLFLAGPGSTHFGSGTDFRCESGYHVFSASVATTGAHYIGMAVVDTGIDPDVNSALLIDNVSLTAIPEPSTWLLLGSGLLALIWWRRRAHSSMTRLEES